MNKENLTEINVASSTTVPSKTTGVDLSTMLKPLLSAQGVGLIVLILVFLILGNMGKNQKITTGRKTGKKEILAATKLAMEQIKNRKHNKVTFWCGTPQYWGKNPKMAFLQTMLSSSPSVWVPHAERSTLVLGAPGGGKTFGTIDRMAESCLKQGFPMLMYARKEEEMEYIAPLAAMYGYDIRIFAPGEPYSEIINPLDFMRDAEDQETAAQIAEVMNSNAKSGGKTGGDDFFDKAANLLAKGLIQLAKSSEFPDLATVYCLQSTNDFVNKLQATIDEGHIPRWIAATFQQYLKAKDSEKTIASIDTTTVSIFSGFIQRSLLPCFMGKSTIDTKLEGKQLIIFKLDDSRRDVVGPLVAAAFHMAVVSNLSTPRKDPIGLFIDELPSLYLKSLARWINEYRSNGACFVLGVQNIKQLSDAYGENQGRAIIGACSTKVLYNPADLATAEEFSKIYGNTEVTLRNKSTSNSSQGTNTSYSESLSTVPIITPDQIMRLPQGKCIMTNPGYSSNGEGSIPYILKIPVPAEDINRMKKCHDLWNDSIKEKLIKRSPQCHDKEALNQAIEERKKAAEKVLCGTPEDKKEESNSGFKPTAFRPKKY